MPLILEAHDSLPCESTLVVTTIKLTSTDIDGETSKAARDQAEQLVQRELRNDDRSGAHPSLPSLPDASFSELISRELDRIGLEKPKETGIDLSRYEEPDEPSADADISAWRESLRNAYISSAYLGGRHVNLALLEELGKNAWLMGNSQIDQILKGLDQELSDLKEQVDSVNRERKAAQEGSHGELQALEETWKKSIGRLIEVQLATDRLREDSGLRE